VQIPGTLCVVRGERAKIKVKNTVFLGAEQTCLILITWPIVLLRSRENWLYR